MFAHSPIGLHFAQTIQLHRADMTFVLAWRMKCCDVNYVERRMKILVISSEIAGISANPTTNSH